MSGYIRLSRKFFKHPYWKQKRRFSPAEAWLDLIATARYDKEPEKIFDKMKIIEINRGELRASQRFLANRWCWSIGKVNRFIDVLKNESMITVNNEHNETVITILNYNKFNPSEKTEWNTNGTPIDTPLNTGNGTPIGTLSEHQQIQTKESIKESIKESFFRQRFFLILEIFYFKNFKNPVSVTKAFYNHYEGIGWKNARGLDIENITSVAENWENKTTQGTNCPPHLLIKWKVMFGILKNNTPLFNQFLLVRPAKLENGILTIRGNWKDIKEIDDNNQLREVWKNALNITFGKVKIEYQPDNQPVEA